MVVPTVEEIRTWSRVDFDNLDYGKADPDPLQVLVDRGVEYVENVTGRKFASMPDEFELTAAEALQRRVEQTAFKSQEEEAQTAADFDTLKSFSAGAYNETRREIGEMVKGKQVNSWPLLHDLLWRMMTEDKRDEWREWWGQIAPAFEVTEVDWHGSQLVPPPTAGLWGN